MMCNEYNAEIKKRIKASGLRHYEVAKTIGVVPSTFSAWLTDDPLPKERRDLILKAIESCKAGKR